MAGLTNSGRDLLAQMIAGEATTPFNNANSYLGVGDSSTAFSAAQTDLIAATNKFRKGMEASYPQRAANVLTYRALFATSEANFAWEEWALFNDPTAGTMLCRKVESLGTKTSAQSWQLTVDITVNNP